MERHQPPRRTEGGALSAYAVVLRADAGPVMGTGHAMRLLALAQGVRARGGEAVFAVGAGDEAYARHRAEGFAVHRIDARDPAEDAERTAELARKLGARWVALDGYDLDERHQRMLRERGLKVMVLDDFGHAREYVADVVVNPNTYAEAAFYPTRAPHTALLLGPRYALLRSEFDAAPARTGAGSRRVLLTFGGSDPHRVLTRVAAMLATYPEPLDITCVVGAYARSDPLPEPGPHAWRVLERPTEMARLMGESDVAIAAAGTTALELARVGVPTLLVVTADNQVRVARAMEAAGAALDLGWHDALATEVLHSALSTALDPERAAAMSASGRRLVDGRGVSRVTAILGAARLDIRPATMEDARLLWDWANDPARLASAFHTEPIPWETHRAWLADRLARETTRIYILRDPDGTPVGQVRFDDDAGFAPRIDVSVAPGARGKGLGAEVLLAAVSRYHAETGAPRVEALVRPANEASMRSFDRAGFVRAADVSANGAPAACWVRELP